MSMKGYYSNYEITNTRICVRAFAIIAIFAFAAFFLSSCKTQQPIVAVERHDSIRSDDRNHSHSESEKEYIHDSIHIRDKGDTVYVDRWHERIIERNVADTIHDSINVAVHDSVPYPVEVTKYIRQRNAYDIATARGFWILLGIISITIVVWIGKKRSWWKLIDIRKFIC